MYPSHLQSSLPRLNFNPCRRTHEKPTSGKNRYGLDIEVPGASILSSFGFNALGLWRDVIGLAVFSGAFVVLAYGSMHLLLVEKR